MTTLCSLRPTPRRAVIGLLAVVAIVGSGVSAGAAPAKPVCNLVTDPADLPDSPSLDVRSADVATDGKNLTAVVRVTDVDSTADPKTATGRNWRLSFTVDTRRILLNVNDGPAGMYDGSDAGATVSVNPAANEVRYTVPLAKLASRYLVSITPGRSKLTNFEAGSDSGVTIPQDAKDAVGLNFQSWGFPDNTKPSAVSYLAGAPSCVKVG